MMVCDNFYESGSRYGIFNSRSFAQIFPSVDEFRAKYEFWVAEPYRFKDASSLNTIFFLMYGRYGNSHIANEVDENQFVAEVMSILFQHGTIWEAKLKAQTTIRSWTEADIMAGSQELHNAAFNPSQETNPGEEILTVNQQNTSRRTRDKMNAYAMWQSMMDADFTEELLARFAHLFSKIINPVGTEIYYTYTEESTND